MPAADQLEFARSLRDRGCHGRRSSPPSSHSALPFRLFAAAASPTLPRHDLARAARSVAAAARRPRRSMRCSATCRRFFAACRIRSCSPAARSRFSTASSTATSRSEAAPARARHRHRHRAGRRRRRRSAGRSQWLCRGTARRRVVEALLIARPAGAAQPLRACRRGRARRCERGGVASRPRRRSRISSAATRRASTRHGVARAAIESLAENFSDGVVAPAFWYLLLGLPGLFAYKMANTLDSMIGHRTPRYRAFGWAAARLDDLLNLVPARLSGAAARRRGGVRRAAPSAGRALRDHAARRGASTARRMPAGRKRRWPARSAWRSPGRGTTPRHGRRSVARRRHAAAPTPPISPARCGSIVLACLIWAGWCSGHGWRRISRSPGEARRARRGEQRVEIEMGFEMVGERVEGRLDLGLVVELARRRRRAGRERRGGRRRWRTGRAGSSRRPGHRR